ncbi:hypothetical protein EC973_009050, partial [Apophysomyces ossiformis]
MKLNTSVDSDNTGRMPLAQEVEDKTSWVAWVQVLCAAMINAACAFMWQSASGAPETSAAWMEVSLTQ